MENSQNSRQNQNNDSREDGLLNPGNKQDVTRVDCESFSNLQLGVLCCLRILDPLNFTQIFPYVNEMVSDLGVARNPSSIGFFSGMVVSTSPDFR